MLINIRTNNLEGVGPTIPILDGVERLASTGAYQSIPHWLRLGFGILFIIEWLSNH